MNVVIEIPSVQPISVDNIVAIDPGLKNIVTLSNGEKIANPRHLHSISGKLAKAQRARKKRLIQKLHTKVKNARQDFLHKLSTRIVNEFECIAIGDVSGARLAKTRMAKAALDAGWSSFRTMLRYKAIARGGIYLEVNERGSTRICSSCGGMTGPGGLTGLGIRQWVCSDCGSEHDRDVNAALNLLARCGHATPAVGASAQ